MRKKIADLKKIINNYKKVIVAFSGGVDSTLLLKVTIDVLGVENVLAITAKSPSFPDREIALTKEIAKELHVNHKIIQTKELENPKFQVNSRDRCYHCKHELFSKLKELAKNEQYEQVFEGSNFDDCGDFRPGMKASKELQVLSPLKEVQLTKAEIREYAKELNVSVWDRPSFACLGSRFPYGDEITKEKLDILEKAEDYIGEFGFKQLRVRLHKDIARIEILPEDFNKSINDDVRSKIYGKLQSLGVKYTCLDLQGYRTGSMNE
jgi:uncharacterized protein